VIDAKVLSQFRKEGIEYYTDLKIVKEKSKDFSHTSPFLIELLNKHSADVLVYPKNEDEVVKVVEIALENHVPIVPRGGGKNNVGGVIPLKGGILMDLSYMNKIEYEEGDEVIVQPSAPFVIGEKFLFNPRVYPSTFNEGATVGGFFSGGSGGIGEFKYGRNWDYVTEVRIVNPKGKIATLRGGDVKIAAHAEGTTGIITKLRVMTRPEVKDIPVLVEFESLSKALNFVEKLFDEIGIYHVTLRSPQMSKLSENITGVSTDKWNVLVVCEDECNIEGNYKAGKMVWDKRFLFFGGTITTAMGAWKKRVYYIVKDIKLEEAFERLTKISEIEDVMIADVEFDVGKVAHPFILTTDKEAYKNVENFLGGTNFDLNSIYINSRLKPEHLHKILIYKKAYDKEDLFNPGKVKFSTG